MNLRIEDNTMAAKRTVMNTMMQIKIVLVAFDKMSRVIRDACGKAI